MIDLHLSDALGAEGLASLADDSVDVTIADPPFDVRAHAAAAESGNWRGGHRRIDRALPFGPFGQAEIEKCAEQIVRVTKRWIVLFVAERQIDLWARALEAAGARFVRLGVALRTNARPQMTGDRPAPGVDLALIAHRAGVRMHWNGGGKPGVWESPAARFDTGRVQLHPTQKPLHLMRALVQDFTDAGELVLDPFAGSGTTALACAQLGRHFIGWEREASYHAAALARLACEGFTAASERAEPSTPCAGAPEPEPAEKASAGASKVSREKASEVSAARPCDYCGAPLRAGARSHARYHHGCRQRAHRRCAS